jgi:hypothetical protein
MSLWKYVLSNCSARLLKQYNTNNTASNAPSEIALLRKSSDQVPTNAEYCAGTVHHRQNFPLSPLPSPLVQHGPFPAIYNNASMPSSLLNSNDYYSPPGSAYPSAVSTPQPIPKNQDVYFQQRGIDMQGASRYAGADVSKGYAFWL